MIIEYILLNTWLLQGRLLYSNASRYSVYSFFLFLNKTMAWTNVSASRNFPECSRKEDVAWRGFLNPLNLEIHLNIFLNNSYVTEHTVDLRYKANLLIMFTEIIVYFENDKKNINIPSRKNTAFSVNTDGTYNNHHAWKG